MKPDASWRLPLVASAFTAHPDRIDASQTPRLWRVIDGPEQPEEKATRAWSVEDAEPGIAFGMTGRIEAMRSMAWSVSMPGDSSGFGYYVLRYRARGVARSSQPFAVVALEGKGKDGKSRAVVLLDAADVRTDGVWHTVVGKAEVPASTGGLAIRMGTLDSMASLQIGEITLHRDLPEVAPDLVGSFRSPAGASFAPVDLASQFNDTCKAAQSRMLTRQSMLIDGGALRSGEQIEVGGIPFRVGSADANLVCPSEDASVNDQPAEIAGVKTTRGFCEPIGRDDVISIPVTGRAREALLLLVAEVAKSHTPYASQPQPFVVEDIGGLACEIRYADGGEADVAFPYSLADGGFRVQRMTGAYAIPVDPGREMREVVLHNRLFGTTVSIAALTLNRGSSPVVPALAQERPATPVPPVALPPPREPFLERRGDRVVLGNRHYDITLNCAQGFSMEKLASHWGSAGMTLLPSSGLEVVTGDTILTGRAFAVESLAVKGRTLDIELRSRHSGFPGAIQLSVTVDDTPRLKLGAKLQNLGEHPLQASVRLPVLRGLTIGTQEDTWLFFPQYRTVITNQNGQYQSPNDLKFPTQFFDVYNPHAGIGIGLLTRNQDNTVVDYSVGKDEDGASAFVQYPGEYHVVAPGKTRTLGDTYLLFHGGDWHEAFRAYREWLATWFRPHRHPGKDWFQKVFALRCHQTKKFFSWGVPIYDTERGQYRVDDFIEADTAYLGLKPEVVHLFGWADQENGWRGHPNGDFDPQGYMGGAEALRGYVKRLQEHHGIPASLYTLSDRCYKGSEIGKAMGERICRRRADGSAVQDEANWFVCPCSDQWHQHYAEGLARTQRETGAKILYVDVFGYPRTSACYSSEHGHPVPSDANKGCKALLESLRGKLPADVSLWSEYPVNDVAFQYLDGNIHYYCLAWHTHFSKLYDRTDHALGSAPVPLNICRYAFPGVKQFVFLCGMANWASDSKFPFLNGEGLYDTSWCLYASPHLDRMRKALALQTAYADCFSCPDPEPHVATELDDVYANRFSAGRRTVWTLFNARYTTVHGPVISVPHVEGATYRDLWNDCRLTPAIANGSATISLRLGPQGLGCIVQERQ